jgi:hypothetical protein
MKTIVSSAANGADQEPEVESRILKLQTEWRQVSSAERALILKDILKTNRYSVRGLAKKVGRDEGTLRSLLRKHLQKAENKKPTDQQEFALCAAASTINSAAKKGLRLRPDWKEKLRNHVASGNWLEEREDAALFPNRSNRVVEVTQALEHFLRYELRWGQPFVVQLLELVQDRVRWCEYYGAWVAPAPESSDPSTEIAKCYKVVSDGTDVEARVEQFTLALFRLTPSSEMREHILRSLLHSLDSRYPAPSGLPL